MSFLDSTGVATLTSDIKAITDATYPANAAIAPPYDSTSAYAVGDFCLKDGLFYKCNTAIASGGETWTAAHWTLTDTADNLGTKMVILAYGSSTWNDFINAYNKNAIVYCRASSNSNPATGNQTRMAFMAYVNANPPTNVEFQYYRSVNSHSATQQGDQVYVYKLDKSAGWTVTVRENYTKIAAGTGLSSSYSSGTLTLNNSQVIPTKTSDLTNDSGFITGYTETDPTVPSWAKQSSKPSYTKSEVGLGNVDNVQQYSASNPPPYPVTSVNGSTGAVTIPTLPSVSSSDNDKVLKVVSGAWAAATSDKQVIITTITGSGYGQYSSSKTYQEIKSVLDSGGIAYAYRSPNFYEVQQYDSSLIIFKRTHVDMSNYLVQDECWYIYSSNNVGYGYANVHTQFRQYIYLVCDDDYSYQDSPSGTFSVDTNGLIDDIMTLFRSVTSDNGNSQVIIDLIYGNPDVETDESACEVYHPFKAYIDIENGDSICTIVYRTLSSRNGLPVVKNVVIQGPIGSYEFLEDATVTYSEYTAFLPSVSSSDNDKVLTVVNGSWAANTPASNNGSSKWTLLWQNPSPTAEAGKGAFTVSLDLTNYDCVLIDYLVNLAESRNMTQICLKGRTHVLMGQVENASTSIRTRKATISNSGVEFTTGYNAASASATSNVPYEIYGGKMFS